MAVLGIPTISVYQDELLDVDQYLIDKGMMIHKPDLTGEFAFDYLQNVNRKDLTMIYYFAAKRPIY